MASKVDKDKAVALKEQGKSILLVIYILRVYKVYRGYSLCLRQCSNYDYLDYCKQLVRRGGWGAVLTLTKH